MKMKVKFGLLGLLILFVKFVPVEGAEHYRKVPDRQNGTDQGNVGDCVAHSQVNALESSFAHAGYPDIRLSLFFRHAKNRLTWSNERLARVKLKPFTEEDRQLLRNWDLIPEYMWPEDGSGYDPFATSIRPGVSEMAVIHPDFPTRPTFNFQISYNRFSPGDQNGKNLDHLKAELDRGHAVIMSLHPVLFSTMVGPFIQFNHKTGLLQLPTVRVSPEGVDVEPVVYSRNNLINALKKYNRRYPGSIGNALTDEAQITLNQGISHAVAVVGYDDSLYSEYGFNHPGALIIRNSWNSPDQIKLAKEEATAEEMVELRKFRLKMVAMNLPGYYAIPYQYVFDLIDNAVPERSSDYTVYSLNYQRFAHLYLHFGKFYEIINAPYSCDNFRRNQYGGINRRRYSNLARGKVQDWKAFQVALTNLFNKNLFDQKINLAWAETGLRGGYNLILGQYNTEFNYARLVRSATLGTDRAREFYQGKFNEYYCGSVGNVVFNDNQVTSLWPYYSYQGRDHNPIVFYDLQLVQKSLKILSTDLSNFRGWESFFRALA